MCYWLLKKPNPPLQPTPLRYAAEFNVSHLSGISMERIIWVNQSAQPFYVFEEKYVVNFWDDGMNISHAPAWYKDINTKLSPLAAPHIYPKALSLEFYRSTLLNDRLPITLHMEGDNLGTVKLTSGYAEADIGAYQRRIINQRLGLELTRDFLVFDFKIETTPVDPNTVHGGMSEEHKMQKSFAFKFQFPLDIVPEILNLTEREKRSFQRMCSRSQPTTKVSK